jgi:hypothetical protein
VTEFSFLGVFKKLQKPTVSLVMSVCLWEHGFNWMDFQYIWYLTIFLSSVEKVQVSLKSDKNNAYCAWRPTYIYDNISLISSFLRMRNVSDNNEIKSKHTLCSISFSRKSGSIWGNVEKYGRAWQATDGNIIQRMVEPDRPQMAV